MEELWERMEREVSKTIQLWGLEEHRKLSRGPWGTAMKMDLKPFDFETASGSSIQDTYCGKVKNIIYRTATESSNHNL